jgi:hypothetical protein
MASRTMVRSHKISNRLFFQVCWYLESIRPALSRTQIIRHIPRPDSSATTTHYQNDATETTTSAFPKPCSFSNIPYPFTETTIRTPKLTAECLDTIPITSVHCTAPLDTTRVTNSTNKSCSRAPTNLHSPALLSHHSDILTTDATECMLRDPTKHARFQVFPYEH